MLDKLGVFISKHPWLVVGLILLITLGFGSLLPTLEMQTSMDDFLPDDETVMASERISYFYIDQTEPVESYDSEELLNVYPVG